MPAFVRNRVKDGIRYIAEDQGVVTILFCSIDNFEAIISNYPSSEITQFLDEIYRKFDSICELTGVTKIETVGNVYMACAGLKDSEAELSSYFRSVSHARRAVEMGLKILSTVEKIFLHRGDSLKVKIGIHTGQVTAGVVGHHKPQFSLVGDTVNTASRMASTLCDTKMIQISQETYSSLGDLSGLSFVNKYVEVKGKGTMETLLVSLSKINQLSEKESLMPVLLSLQSNSNYKDLQLRSSLRLESYIIPTNSANSSTVISEPKSSISSTVIVKLEGKGFNYFDYIPFVPTENPKDNILRNKMLDNHWPALFGGI